ncbi:hypothetical protein [Metabacillus fastidiosus]
MKTLIYLCHSCGMEYEITFNEHDFVEPEHCAGCGINDDSLQIEVKET